MCADFPKTGVGLIAGEGLLPRMLAEDRRMGGHPYHVIGFDGIAPDWLADHPATVVPFEKPGRMIAALRDAGCTHVCFAGAMRRPDLKLWRADATLLALLPRLLPMLRGGDDGLLRFVAEAFEARGFTVIAAHDLSSGLLAPEEVLTRAQPSPADREDAARASVIAAALGSVDVGQGAVVAQGLCLGAETVQGTDAMLRFVAESGEAARPDPTGAKGVLYKAPKPGQDRRSDMPAIGPDTVKAAAEAGLAGIAVEAGGVMILAQDATVEAADEAGLFLWGRPVDPDP